MEEARAHSLRLREYEEGPAAAEQRYDAARAAEAADFAAVAHGARDEDGDDDAASSASSEDLVAEEPSEPTDEDVAQIAGLFGKAERLKEEGNESFKAACAASTDSERRDLAADAAIYYLDVLDTVYLAERVRSTPEMFRS